MDKTEAYGLPSCSRSLPIPASPSTSRKKHISWKRLASFGKRGHEREHKAKKSRTSTSNSSGSGGSASFDETRVWDKKSILSLDGGGIRGYSSLLILRELMKAIEEIERIWPDDPAESSFHPIEPPRMPSDAALTPLQASIGFPGTNGSSSWLPYHYFDYMAGTSTGGFISIMLGRLRMSIDDCITEYETLGPKIFAHPRWLHLRSPLFWPRDKYDHRSLEKVIRDVVDRRSPFVGGKNFASDENRCRTIVLSYRKQESTGVETPYLFRSYDNLHRNADPTKRLLDRNPGLADNNRIWQVARATSAAPTYFKPTKIDGIEYLDGGFGANNPCSEMYDEVRRMNNGSDDCVDIIISVGTGKNPQGRFKGTGLERYVGFLHFAAKWASESEEAHQQMLKLNGPFYARFNVGTPIGSIKLDEWRSRGALRIKTGEAIGKLRFGRAPKPQDLSENDFSSSSSDSISSPPPHLRKIPKYFLPRHKTLEKITAHTEKYLALPDTQLWIRSSAKRLVDRRRERAKQGIERWEKNCYRTWYHCKVPNCLRGEPRYETRDEIRNHMLHKHKDHPLAVEMEKTLDQFKFLIL